MTMSDQSLNDFWYDFDNFFNSEFYPQPTVEQSTIFSAVGIVMNHFRPQIFQMGSMNTTLLSNYLQREEVSDLLESMELLIPHYMEIMTNHLGEDFEQAQSSSFSLPVRAFQNFGLGKLYDPRPPRNRGKYMHLMDMPKIGFIFWHRFHWAASLLEQSWLEKWQYLDRLIGVAAELDAISKPRQSNPVTGLPPNNPPNGTNVSPFVVKSITVKWLGLNFDQIEIELSKIPHRIIEIAG